MKINSLQKTLLIYLVFLCLFWLWLFFSGYKTNFWNYFYSFSFSQIPLIGGLVGVLVAKPWGGLKSSLGKSISLISFGLFSWGLGSMIWSYYNFFRNIPAPYPSLADLGFVLSLPLWTFGMISISKATGAKFGLQHKKGKILLILIPFGVFIFSYYALVIIARGGQLTGSFESYLKLSLDLAYPLGDVLILTISLLIFGLSYKYLGGKYRLTILSILLGFVTMYFADFVFSYTTTVGTFYNGSLGDLFFTAALFFITFGTLGFYRDKNFS